MKTCKDVIVSEDSVPDDTVIWRYLRFERFVDILDTHAFWFARPFKFVDEWEGFFPPSYIRQTRNYAATSRIPFDEFDRDFRVRWQQHRYAHFVNCWNVSEHELDAMWRLYGRGIAIQSTVGSVNECLRPHNSGRVIYYDPADNVRSASMFGPHDILFKRSSYSCEQEYRFWFADDELLEAIDAGRKFREEDLTAGRLVGISDAPLLFKRIVVAPGASDDFIDDVRRVCRERRRSWLANRIERSYSDLLWQSFSHGAL